MKSAGPCPMGQAFRRCPTSLFHLPSSPFHIFPLPSSLRPWEGDVYPLPYPSPATPLPRLCSSCSSSVQKGGPRDPPKALLFFRLVSACILRCEMCPKSSQKWSPILIKSTAKIEAAPKRFFGRFFFDFGAPAPLRISFSLKRRAQIHICTNFMIFS